VVLVVCKEETAVASEPGWRVAGKEEVGVAESLEALEELVVATVVEEVGGSSLQGRSLCTPQPRTLPLCTSSRIFSMRRGWPPASNRVLVRRKSTWEGCTSKSCTNLRTLVVQHATSSEPLRR
jgi:hypothetical protein